MKVRALSVIAAAALVALFVAPAARAASPPPVSPPPVKGPGVSAIPVSSTPFNFVFATRVTGNGFRPGERVTISVERAGAAPISVNAGPDGTVSAVLTFSWVFCGPNAVTTAPPIIVLAGSSGSRQQVALPASPCPRLVVTLPPAVKVPPSGGTGSVGGTASTGPPVPAPGPLPDPRLRVPSAQIVDVMGFGFAPHEIVQLTEIGFSSAPQTTTVSADTLGRLTAALHLLVPPPCSAQVGRIWLVASGNRGTTAAAPIGFWRPVALMCPVTSGGTTKPDNPPSPAAATAGAASPGLHLAHTAVRRGHAQSAVIGLPTGTSLTVSVAYPGGAKQTFRRRTSQVDTVIRWHVPAKARPGTATVTMASPSLSLTLEQRFTVR